MSEQTQPSIPKGKVFVTGGAGHVGANVVQRLLDQGHELRCLVQPGTNNAALDGLDVERVEGDIRDPESMKKAIKGCTRVFHVAAKVSVLNATAGEEREIFEINVLGTRNVLRAALHNDVARAVLTGSFSAVGYDLDDPSKPSNEDMPFYPFQEVMPYARSKVLAELEALRAMADGLDVVIATSCGCMGPHDYLPSRTGRTMLDYAHGRFRAYIDGGFDWVSAQDLAEGHLLAMEKGRTGQKYIFSTHFHSLDEVVRMWARTLGTDRLPRKLPASVMSAVTGIYSGSMAKFFPNMPQRFSPGAIRIMRMRRRADTSKAQKELGYRPTSIPQAVYDQFEFFARQGRLPAGVKLRPPEPSTDARDSAPAAAE